MPWYFDEFLDDEDMERYHELYPEEPEEIEYAPEELP